GGVGRDLRQRARLTRHDRFHSAAVNERRPTTVKIMPAKKINAVEIDSRVAEIANRVWWGCFMRRRAEAGPTVGAPRPARSGDMPTTRHTTVDPAQLDGGQRFPFLAQLHLPHGILRSSIWRADDGRTVTELRAPDGSWAEIDRDSDPDGRHCMREAGPTALWAQVEIAWQQWIDLDAPPWHEFGLTATPQRHTVWHRSPDGQQWALPLPD
ncbi:MAG: hypothetical protein ACRDRK_27890, partial [Pseudonocardia sp.]